MFLPTKTVLTEEEKQQIRKYVDQKWSADLSKERRDIKYEKYCYYCAEWKDRHIKTIDDVVDIDDITDWTEVREKLPDMDVQMNYLLSIIKELKDRLAAVEIKTSITKEA